jgi:hypothetical protein
MRRTATLTVALTAGLLLVACTPGDDDTAPTPTTTVTQAADPHDACLADLVRAYPTLDPGVPMLDQVDTCKGLDDTTKSSVLGTLQEYDDAAQEAVDAAREGQ